jgi:hypothetical protein
MTMTGYTDISTLAEVVLAGSFVLRIEEKPQELRFIGEFVLTPKHPAYHPPAPDEQECYADGYLVFPATTRVDWAHLSHQGIHDATGEEDLGSIDELDRVDDHWLIGGEWGKAQVYSDEPRLVLTDADDM